eukprot:scaffold48936_cov15-Prasinocladus_malaysianus.AAC.1
MLEAFVGHKLNRVEWEVAEEEGPIPSIHPTEPFPLYNGSNLQNLQAVEATGQIWEGGTLKTPDEVHPSA